MIAALMGLPGKINTLLSRITDTRAGYLDAAISSRANPSEVNAEVDSVLNTPVPGSPAVDSMYERLKRLEEDITTARAAALDSADAASVWSYPDRTITNSGGFEQFLANGTFIVPAGVFLVWYSGCGAGGGGGGAGSGTSPGAGGAGGETVFELPIPVTPGQNIGVVVGAAGSGGSTNADGGAGGDTVISLAAPLRLFGGFGGAGGGRASLPLDAKGRFEQPFGAPPTRTVAGFTAGASGGLNGDPDAGWPHVFEGGVTPGTNEGKGGAGGAFGRGGDGGTSNAPGESAAANSGAGGGGGGGNNQVGGDGGSGRAFFRW